MIRILCVGKIKEPFYQEAIKEYMKRLSKYHKVIIEELSDSNKQKEEELLLKKIRGEEIETLTILPVTFAEGGTTR